MHALEIHVSPDGQDDAPGSREHPLRTLEAARDAVRRRPRGAGAIVWLHSGRYELVRSLTLETEDSGAPTAPVIYRTAEGETVRLTGGLRLPAEGFQPLTDTDARALDPAARPHVRTFDLKALGISDFGAVDELGRQCELFFDAAPLPLARWPNDGFVAIDDLVPEQPIEAHGLTGDAVGNLIYSGERPTRWIAELDHLRLHGYWFWDWSDSYARVAAIEPARRLMRLAPPHHKYGYRKGQRFYALNLLCELDRPGEWFLDADSGRLYVWPAAALEGADIQVSLLDTPLIALNDVAHVTLEGLTLECARGVAIRITQGAQNRIAHCTIRMTGANGIEVAGGTQHRIEHCEVRDTGAAAIVLAGGDRPTLTPSGHAVTDCRLHRFGRIQRTYAGALTLDGVGHTIARNDIHDGPHLAILFYGNDHLIEHNRIHHVCGETGDVGAIYTGRDWTARGTVIRENRLYAIRGPGLHGAQAIYLDDAASGMSVIGNTLEDCDRAILMGGGRDNRIEDNVIRDCTHSIHADNRGLNWMQDHVQPGGIMRQSLEAVPYGASPWAERYPELLTLLDDEPGCPKHNTIRGNRLERSGVSFIAPEVRQYGTVERDHTNVERSTSNAQR